MKNLEVMLAFDSRDVTCSRADTWQQLWKYSAEKSIWNDAIGCNEVYLAGFTHLYALDKQTGELIWKKSGFEMIKNIIPCNDTILVADMAKGIYALSAQDGELKWGHLLKRNSIHDMLESNGKVYVSSSRGLFSLDTKNGNDDKPLNKNLWFSLAETGDAIYAVNEGCILKLGKRTGNTATYTGLYSPIKRITADENALYLLSKDCIAALNGKNLAKKWEKPIKNIDGAFRAQGLSLYAAELQGQFYAIDKDTGEVQWEHEYPHRVADVKEVLFREEERVMLLIEDLSITHPRKTYRYVRIPICRF